LEDVDRLPHGNVFVESTLKLVANVTELAENLPVLLSQKSLMINQILEISQQFINYKNEMEFEILDMMDLTFGNLAIGKSISLILNNLCSGQSI
jgi:hypothetical protein